MTYIVTGAAGFIGANIVRALNARGETDIVAVDNLKRGDKFRNLAQCEISDYLDKEEFLELVRGNGLKHCRAVFHEGACSDTMEHDGRYMMENNYRYSVALLDACQRAEIPFLYASSASVYGAGRVFQESREHEGPLNVYGYSKFLFDQHVRRVFDRRTAQIAGFRYFNVYGPMENHKDRMASVAYHFFQQMRRNGHVNLFEGCDGYGNGEQRRDFVFVEDVVDVNLFFLDHPERSGIFNLGTGRAQSFNDVAVAAVNAWRASRGETALSLSAMLEAGIIRYIPFPDALKGKYQSYTEADIGKLREAGYQAPFHDVAAGVGKYVQYLLGEFGGQPRE